MTTLLVLTTGRTDVQLVVGGVRHELHGECCAALHDEIERRGYRLCDSPVQKGEPAEELPEGELSLCTPKLDAVLDKESITAALVLDTRRDASAACGDPRYAGAVLEARLKAKGVGAIHRRSYLEGGEYLEDRDQPRDAVIRRAVVHRLEQAVHEAIAKLAPSRIVVATTGGFPGVASLVEEIVGLHASMHIEASIEASIEALEVADGTKSDPPTADRAIPRTSVPEPQASFQARRRALELIERGNLLGAWAVAEPLHDDEVEHRWTRVVKWLKCFASSLPIPKECDIPVISHQRMAVRAALRVELALRAEYWPRAVHGTVAFFEAALWDGLNERFERSDDPERRRYYRIKSGCEPPRGEKLLWQEGDCERENRKRPFEWKEKIDGVDWFWIHDGGGGPAARIAKRFLKRDKLRAFEVKLSTKKIRFLRNDVVHNEPTPKLMDEAREKMQNAELWSDEDTFLSQSLVQDVLRELGECEPQRLLDDLLDDVRHRLVRHDCTQAAP